MSSETEQLVSKILKSKTVAVVGLSKDPSKPSHDVAAYLKTHGYRIIPVNPTVDMVLGERAYKSLTDIPQDLQRQIEVVDVFRRSDDIPPIVDEAIQLHGQHGHPWAVWMQLGIVNEEAAAKAQAAGLSVVMDRCMKIEHSKRQER